MKLKRRSKKKEDFDWREDMCEFRARKSKVKLTPVKSYLYPQEFSLSITHNGWQWTSIHFNETEGFQIYKLLAKKFGSTNTKFWRNK